MELLRNSPIVLCPPELVLYRDGDLEKELGGSNVRRGYAFDNHQVVATCLGIVSCTFHKKLDQEGFCKDKDEVEIIGPE